MPRVSVIVVNWNGKEHLGSCLMSLNRQTFRDFEIILVDNGSTDNSVRFVEGNFPQVKVIRLSKNIGFAGGNNEGIKTACGEYVTLLNNDTEVHSNWLEELVKAVEKDEKIGIAASKILRYGDRKIIDSAGDMFGIWGLPYKRGSLEYDRGQYDKTGMDIFSGCGASVLYRKKMLEEIGVLDEDFFCYYEDVDIGFRARLLGWECVYAPASIVWHKVSATSGKVRDKFKSIRLRNILYLYFKNMPFDIILYGFPLFLFGFVLKCTINIDGINGVMEFLRKLPDVAKKRKLIQRNRKISSISLIREMDKNLFKCFKRIGQHVFYYNKR